MLSWSLTAAETGGLRRARLPPALTPQDPAGKGRAGMLFLPLLFFPLLLAGGAPARPRAPVVQGSKVTSKSGTAGTWPSSRAGCTRAED